MLARSFKKNNERRHELIRKKNRDGLTVDEWQELEALKQWCREWVDNRHPLPGVVKPKTT
jgi:hypothetical protein